MAIKIDALMRSAPQPKNNGQGVEHAISLGYYKLINEVETFMPVLTKIFPIPAYRMQEELSSGTTTERITKYKDLILEYMLTLYSGIPVPPAPTEPTINFTGAENTIQAIVEYADAYDNYEIALAYYLENEYADYLTEFDAENSLAVTWANNTTNFVESRVNFEGYPYPFNIQLGE